MRTTRIGFILALMVASVIQTEAQGPHPYIADGATAHLWHLDEAVVPAADSVPAALGLGAAENGATLNQASFPGFGAAVGTVDGGVAGGNNSMAIDAYLAPVPLTNGAQDNVNWSFDDPVTGAFTFEAVVCIGFDPLANLGATRNLPMQILSGDQDISGGGVRSWQFRLLPVGFNPNADGITVALTSPALEFINITGGASVQSFITVIPTNGVHGIVSNGWYHVAVTYSGNEGVAGNLQVYWTLMHSNRTAAARLSSRQMNADLNRGGAVDFCVGNTGRTVPNNNFIGKIDEVRISSVARGSNAFVFRGVSVLQASATPELQNPPQATLDGDLNTRWSAQGDGQWITFDLGRAELVTAVDIAFYLGNIRSTTFDVLLSNDTLAWRPAITGVTSSGTNLNLERYDLPDFPARYVRIVGHGNSSGNGWNSLTEVVIHRSLLIDSDADGLPDFWEQFYFGGLQETSAGDPDGDALSNALEYLRGFDPTEPNDVEDSDGDGLPDAWEQLWFGGLGETGGGDADRDGVIHLEEWLGGADPMNPNSVPGDTDGDSLPDAWELSAFGDLSRWAYDDADGDGYNNVAEKVAGTPPMDPASRPDWVSPRVAFLGDSVVVTNACLMPAGSTYGRAINGISYQEQPLLFNGYQYIAWYDTSGTTQRVWLGRRAVQGVNAGVWEVLDTGSELLNGDEPGWDAHNVIALGICRTDGTLHFSWDHHGHTLRYRRSVAGLCTTNLAAWGAGAIQPEQNWLVASGQTISSVTYPRFFNTPAGELVFAYRTGSTSAGDHWLHNYSASSGAWEVRRKFSAKEGTFSDVSMNGGTFTSTSRNAYENGYGFGPDGTLHYTWTYREATANPSNHDIHYAYSSDGGFVWRNNAGSQIADTGLGHAIQVDSPGIIVKVIDSRQLLINQQAQCVDHDGRVHVLMLHRRVEPGFEWTLGDAAFATQDTAYYHYFRDPGTGAWSQRRLPLDISVGSRPKVGFDGGGNLYAVYVGGYASSAVPGYDSGKLVVATASKVSQYSDWSVTQVIDVNFAGEPLLDQERLLRDRVLSVFVQENSTVNTVVGTPLHVMDFAVGVSHSGTMAVNFVGEQVLITIPGEKGSMYQLQAASALGPEHWENIGSAVAGTGGLIALPDSALRHEAQRFYKVVKTQ